MTRPHRYRLALVALLLRMLTCPGTGAQQGCCGPGAVSAPGEAGH